MKRLLYSSGIKKIEIYLEVGSTDHFLITYYYYYTLIT